MNSPAPLANNSIGALLVGQKHDEIRLAHRFGLGRLVGNTRWVERLDQHNLGDDLEKERGEHRGIGIRFRHK